MLTKEQVRARYFACYIGSKIKVDYPSENYPQYENCDFEYILKLHDKSEHLSTNWKYNKLSLRPLSAITDEDVSVFGRMFYPKGWDKDTEEVKAFKEYLAECGLYFAIHECVCPSHDLWLLIYDMLRSMGYYTGSFMGYDPIAEGWCIVDEKNVQP